MGSVEYSLIDGVAGIQINRPEILNALDDDTVAALRAALIRLDDEKDALVAVLSGAGRAFCSGADVRQRQMRTPAEMIARGGPSGRDLTLESLFLRCNHWKPVVVAVHGYVLGAGMRLLLHADLAVAAEDTRFQITEVSRGLDASPYLAMLAQRGAGDFANEVCLTGRFFTAQEAVDHGVVSALAPAGEHIAVATERARQIAANPPLAVRAVVRARRQSLEALELQSRAKLTSGLYLTRDFQESAAAFMEKRKPHFVGE